MARAATQPMKKVVLAHGDRATAELYSGWLRQAGFHVVVCPGPSAPTYHCFMLQTSRCPIVAEADLLVYDPWLECDTDETSATDLVRALRGRYAGTPILVLGMEGGFPSDLVRLSQADPGVRLFFRPDRWTFQRAATEMAGPHRTGHSASA